MPYLGSLSERGYKDWKPGQRRTRERLKHVLDVLDEYAEQLPLTVRQVYYRCVGRWPELYTGKEARIQQTLNDARRARKIPFEWIRDDGVYGHELPLFDSPDAFKRGVRDAARGFRRDLQAGQEQFVELWCETAGMVPQLARVADPYSVPVYSGGGGTSLTRIRDTVDRVAAREQPTVLLHLGDFNAMGITIFEHLSEDVPGFLADDAPGTEFKAERIALRSLNQIRSLEQAGDYRLPPELKPLNPKDRVGVKWPHRTEDGRLVTYELEALPPDELAALVKAALDGYINPPQRLRVLAQQDRDRDELVKWAEGE